MIIPEGATHYTGVGSSRVYWRNQSPGQWHCWDRSHWMPRYPESAPVPLHSMTAGTFAERVEAELKRHDPLLTAPDYLSEALRVQQERGKDYDKPGGERSFAATAAAYNAITGRGLKGSDVALMLNLLKHVRQYSDPTRLHADSLVDAVGYSSLWAGELTQELRE